MDVRDEIQRRKDDVRSTIAVGRFELSRSCASMRPQASMLQPTAFKIVGKFLLEV
jgi:hypothetical protein